MRKDWARPSENKEAGRLRPRHSVPLLLPTSLITHQLSQPRHARQPPARQSARSPQASPAAQRAPSRQRGTHPDTAACQPKAASASRSKHEQRRRWAGGGGGQRRRQPSGGGSPTMKQKREREEPCDVCGHYHDVSCLPVPRMAAGRLFW